MHDGNRRHRRFNVRHRLSIVLATALLCSGIQVDAAPKASVAAAPAPSLSSSDRIFLADAAAWNQREIDISRFAATHASSTAVRQFAQMMVHDHTALAADLTKVDIAILPPAPSADPNPNLVYKSGAEFDKTYLSLIIAEHERMASKFQVIGEGTLWSKTVRDAARNAVPMLRRHDATAKSLDRGIVVTR